MVMVLIVISRMLMATPVDTSVLSGITVTTILESVVGTCIPDHVSTGASSADLGQVSLVHSTIETSKKASFWYS